MRAFALRGVIVPVLATLVMLLAITAPAGPPVARAAAGDAAPVEGKAESKKGAARKSAAQKEADAFLQHVAPLVLAAETVAAQADWAAAVDVTPDHTGQRIGADRVQAAVSGAPFIIEQ